MKIYRNKQVNEAVVAFRDKLPREVEHFMFFRTISGKVGYDICGDTDHLQDMLESIVVNPKNDFEKEVRRIIKEVAKAKRGIHVRKHVEPKNEE